MHLCTCTCVCALAHTQAHMHERTHARTCKHAMLGIGRCERMGQGLDRSSQTAESHLFRIASTTTWLRLSYSLRNAGRCHPAATADQHYRASNGAGSRRYQWQSKVAAKLASNRGLGNSTPGATVWAWGLRQQRAWGNRAGLGPGATARPGQQCGPGAWGNSAPGATERARGDSGPGATERAWGNSGPGATVGPGRQWAQGDSAGLGRQRAWSDSGPGATAGLGRQRAWGDSGPGATAGLGRQWARGNTLAD